MTTNEFTFLFTFIDGFFQAFSMSHYLCEKLKINDEQIEGFPW